MTTAYMHCYPWQLLTRVTGLRLSCRIERQFDVARLQAELTTILDHHRPRAHFSGYHDGGWGAIALVACEGDMDELRPQAGAYRKTPAMSLAPYIESVVDGLGCKTGRVRLMELRAGSNVYWHYDRSDHLAAGSARLHIPIVTHDKIDFQISHEDCRWRAGELWYGDFSFPHRLVNRGEASRVHLVIDCVVNDAVLGLFPAGYLKQERIARRARRLCHRMIDAWEGRRRRAPAVAAPQRGQAGDHPATAPGA